MTHGHCSTAFRSSSTPPARLSAWTAQFELLAGLGYRKVEPFGGLLADPAAARKRCSTRTA